MLLKDYFIKLEAAQFGPVLQRFKATFNQQDLNADYSDINKKFLEKEEISIIGKINKITNKSLKVFKDFVLSTSKESQYYNCRTLQKVDDVDRLIKKFQNDESFEIIKQSTEPLLDYINEKAHIYYAIANSLEESAMEQLSQEIIGHIFHYVDGDIVL